MSGELRLDQGIDPYLNTCYWDGLMVGQAFSEGTETYRKSVDLSDARKRQMAKFSRKVLRDFLMRNGRGALALEYYNDGTLSPNQFATGSVISLQHECLSLEREGHDTNREEADGGYQIPQEFLDRIYEQPGAVAEREFASGPLLLPYPEYKKRYTTKELRYTDRPDKTFHETETLNMYNAIEYFEPANEDEWQASVVYRRSRHFLVVAANENDGNKYFSCFMSRGYEHISEDGTKIEGLGMMPYLGTQVSNKLGIVRAEQEFRAYKMWAGDPIVYLSRDNQATLYADALPEKKRRHFFLGHFALNKGLGRT